MPSGFFYGLPGIGTIESAVWKALFLQRSEEFLPQGRFIDPANSRDPSNTVDVGVLQPGLVMGKITASGYYAPSIYGLTNGALTASGTTVTLPSAAVGTEIVRRKGATGTVSIIGPPTAGGVVRTSTATYSAISGTSMTITALGVNAVQQVNFNVASTGGTVSLLVPKTNGVMVQTAPATWSTTDATYLANIQSALDTATGVSSGIVVTAIPATDADLGFILTYSGAGYAGLPQPVAQVVGTLPTSSTSANVVTNTAGVDGRFVTKSIIAPVDGSQVPLAFITDWSPGIKVTDSAGVSIGTVVDMSKFPIAGQVDIAQMINWPADTSLALWLEQQLSTAQGGKFIFGGVGGVY
jgi:hypothetical protein